MIHWLESHALVVVLVYYVFNAIVSGMPEPLPNGNLGYLWAYRSLHTLAGNFDKIAKSKGIQ